MPNIAQFCVVAALAASFTSAVGISVKAEDVFTGFYVGLEGGVSSNRLDVKSIIGSTDGSDVAAGGLVNIGYDYQWDHVVVGAFARAGFDANESERNGIKATTGAHYDVGGRIGLVVSPNIMVFALAGATRQRIEVRGYGWSDSGDRDGVFGGGGVEVAVDKDWMVGLQGEGT
ncbi:MAG: outer membrane protein, partial [Hyphomicrobiaceae bacterium]